MRYKILLRTFSWSFSLLFLMSAGMWSSKLSAQTKESVINIVGWDKFKLGMSYEAVLTEIKNTEHPWINWKDRRATSFIFEEDKSLIGLFPNEYLIEGHFHFNKDNKLYLIRMVLSKKYFSYLSLLRKLKSKYGPPTDVRYAIVAWKQEDVILQLERRGILRYFDKNLFSQETGDDASQEKDAKDKKQIEQKTVESVLDTL